MTSIHESWGRIETWLHAHLPEVAASLNPPASEQQITDLEAAIGRTLPEDFKALYRIHDGQSGYNGAFVTQIWMPLKSIEQAHGLWAQQLHEPGIQDAISPLCGSHPEGSIHKVYINTGWIPWTDDGGGNHFGLDLDPDGSGTWGQVINFGRDQEQKYVLAASLAASIEWVADRLEDGTIRAADTYGSGLQMTLSDPTQQGTLRLLPALLGYT